MQKTLFKFNSCLKCLSDNFRNCIALSMDLLQLWNFLFEIIIVKKLSSWQIKGAKPIVYKVNQQNKEPAQNSILVHCLGKVVWSVVSGGRGDATALASVASSVTMPITHLDIKVAVCFI